MDLYLHISICFPGMYRDNLPLCDLFCVFYSCSCVRFWDLESCWFWCGYVGNGLCRLVGCVVAVGEMCCGEGHTACLSSAWRKEAE